MAVEVRGVPIYMLGYAYLYMVHVLQYATDVKNLMIKNLTMRFLGEINNVTS